MVQFLRRYRWPIALAVFFVAAAFLATATIRPAPVSQEDLRTFLVTALLSAAVAAVASMVSSHAVESKAHNQVVQSIAHMEQRANEVVDQVFRGISLFTLGANESKLVTDEVLRTISSSPFVREDYHSIMSFSSIAEEPYAVRLTQEIRYRLINSARFAVQFEPKFGFDQTSLLYPDRPELKSPRLQSVVVGRRRLSQRQIDAINHQYDDQAAAGEFAMRPVPLLKTLVSGHGNLDVGIIWESVEPIDSHWLARMFIPTTGIRLTVRNDLGPKFLIQLEPLTSDDFEEKRMLSADGTFWETRYKGVALPNSGWILRWNLVRGDVPPALNPPAPTPRG